MTVCRYYIRGTCDRGNNCRFEHPGDGGYSQYHYQAQQGNRYQAQNQPQLSQDIINIRSELDQWEKGKQWPLSSFGPQRQNLPGFVDVSPEELRYYYILAAKSNALDSYVSGVKRIYQEAQSQRDAARKPEFQNILDRISRGETFPQNKDPLLWLTKSNPFGSTVAKPGIFGGSGTPTNDSVAKTLFGGSTGGKSLFGGQSSENAAGQSSASFSFKIADHHTSGPPHSSTPSPFGTVPQSSSSPFGASSQPVSSPFGASSQPVSSPFGAPSQPVSSPFGAPSQPVSSPFGAPSQPVSSPFATPSQPVSSPFATPSQPVSSPFGGTSSSSPSQQNLFGGTIPIGQQSTGASNFSFAQPSAGGGVDQRSLFGKPQQIQESVSTGAGTGLFGKSSTSASAAVSIPIYTQLSDLTAQDKEQFEAPSFCLGKIPINPPPSELC